MNDDRVVELEAGDGQISRCRVLDILTLDAKEYALLEDLESSSLVVMQLVQNGDQTIFRTIESDEEFERVTTFIRALAEDSRASDD